MLEKVWINWNLKPWLNGCSSNFTFFLWLIFASVLKGLTPIDVSMGRVKTQMEIFTGMPLLYER